MLKRDGAAGDMHLAAVNARVARERQLAAGDGERGILQPEFTVRRKASALHEQRALLLGIAAHVQRAAADVRAVLHGEEGRADAAPAPHAQLACGERAAAREEQTRAAESPIDRILSEDAQVRSAPRQQLRRVSVLQRQRTGEPVVFIGVFGVQRVPRRAGDRARPIRAVVRRVIVRAIDAAIGGVVRAVPQDGTIVVDRRAGKALRGKDARAALDGRALGKTARKVRRAAGEDEFRLLLGCAEERRAAAEHRALQLLHGALHAERAAGVDEHTVAEPKHIGAECAAEHGERGHVDRVRSGETNVVAAQRHIAVKHQ